MLSKSTMKVLTKVKVKLLNEQEIKYITDTALIRAISGKSLVTKYNKDTGEIEKCYSNVELIPVESRFNKLTNDISNSLLSYYKYTNNFIEWSSQNKEYSYKDKTYIIDEYKRQTFINNINDNLKNECYVYVYQYINRIKKYMYLKKNILNIKNTNAIEYYNKLTESKHFKKFLNNITYIEQTIKGKNTNKDYKSFRLMCSLAKNFSLLMLESYREKDASKYDRNRYKIELTSIYDANGDIIEIGSTLSHYDNIEIYDMLVKELTNTEISIMCDIKKGHKYTDIQAKYSISSKTIVKIKNKIFSLLQPNTNKLTDKLLKVYDYQLNDTDNKVKAQNITVDANKQGNMFNWYIYNNNKLNIKVNRIDSIVNFKSLKGSTVNDNQRYYNKLNDIIVLKGYQLKDNITDINDKALIGNKCYYDFSEYLQYQLNNRNDYTIRIKREFKTCEW